MAQRSTPPVPTSSGRPLRAARRPSELAYFADADFGADAAAYALTRQS